MHRFLTVLEETATTATEENANAGGFFNDMGGMLTIILLIMLIGSGVYALYTYIRLHRTCMLFPNKFLYPGGCTADKCVDEDGFIEYIEPRLLLLGIAMILCGIVYGAYSMVWKKSFLWADILTVMIPAGVFVWYMVVQRKAAKNFW